MRIIRVSLKYFTFGLIAGLLLAPRAGRETRQILIDQGADRLQKVLGAREPATPPTVEAVGSRQ